MGCCCGKGYDQKRDQRRSDRSRSRNRGQGRARDKRPTRRPEHRTEEQIAYQLLMRERSSTETKVCVATFAYEPGSPAEIQLEKGDRVELLEQKEEDTEDFVFVKVLKEGGKIGYVATNFLAPEDSIEAEDYYFGPIKRRDAMRILRNEALPGGSYLVRDSETTYESQYDGHGGDVATPYVLSVKDKSQPPNLHHYRIYDAGARSGVQRYYISSPSKFKKIPEIITFYAGREVPSEICCKLTSPVPRPPPVRKVLSKDLLERWREIPREQIELLEQKGSGNFGTVFRALWKPTEGNPMTVAAKQLKDVTTKAKDLMFKEAASMRLLSHKNIVRLYGVVSSGDPYLMITEFVKDGSLKEYLLSRRHSFCFPPLPDVDLIDIATQICRGMAYLESKNVVHRDLAARNVLINKLSEKPIKMEVKICDFGLARALGDTGIYKMARDTALAQMWLAPEAFNKNRFTSKADVWAYGCALCELFGEGEDPFPNMPPAKLTKLLKHGTRPSVGTKAMRRAHVEELIFRPCTRLDPDDRPTFAELLSDLETLLSSRDDVE